MNAWALPYPAFARRARRTRRVRAIDARAERLVAEDRLAASLPSGPRPVDRIDAHLFQGTNRPYA